jgi:hypothetical protein
MENCVQDHLNDMLSEYKSKTDRSFLNESQSQIRSRPSVHPPLSRSKTVAESRDND